jgi:hypothetical protein
MGKRGGWLIGWIAVVGLCACSQGEITNGSTGGASGAGGSPPQFPGSRCSFPDPALANAVAHWAEGFSGLPEDSVSELTVGTVKDLRGIDCLAHLVRLTLSDASLVTDFSPLAGHPTLADLSVDFSTVTDLSPLGAMAALASLRASGTAVSDLEPLRGKSALRLLHLDGTRVADLSPLRDLGSLEEIDVTGTSVVALSPLNRQPLDTILADRTKVTSLAGIDFMPKLRLISIDNSAVSSLGTIERLSPAILRVAGNPLDSESLLVVQRLCDAGWGVAWNGEICGDDCQIYRCNV